MAENAEPTGRVEELPQRFDVWQADAREVALPLPDEAPVEPPWMTVIASDTEDQVLGYELGRKVPTIDEVWDALCKAMLQPESSEPHRPTEIQVARADWQEGLKTRLAALNIGCSVVEELAAVEEVFEAFGDEVALQAQPGLLDMPGITPPMVASFYEAAAAFFEAEPWMTVGERPIRIEAAKYETSTWYAVPIGQGGMSSGLILYDDFSTLERIQQGDLDEEESARLTSALALTFGDPEDLPMADSEAIEKHGWRVAGPEAYPSIYRMEPGLNMRPPLVWELELMDGALQAVAEFLRKKTRRQGPVTMNVPVGEGTELVLVLEWVE